VPALRASLITAVFWAVGWLALAVGALGLLGVFLGSGVDPWVALGAVALCVLVAALFMAVAQALDCLTAMARDLARVAAALDALHRDPAERE
jgi:hypothetical protein